MKSKTKPKLSRFFGQNLTSRHLLTRILIGGLCLVGLLALAAAYRYPDTLDAAGPAAASTQSESDRQAVVRLLKVSTSQLRSAGPDFLTQNYTGIVTARRSSRLAAKAVGLVEFVNVKLGDKVTTGDLLIQLDNDQLAAQLVAANANLAAARSKLQELERGPRRQDIEQAESQVAELQANLQLGMANLVRNERLLKTASIAKQQYDESRFLVEALQAQIDSANQALERLREGTRKEQIEAQRGVVDGLSAEVERIAADLVDRKIVAPFNGHIQNRLVDEGAVVAPGQALLEIVESAPFEVRVGLPPEVAQHLTESNLAVFRGKQKLSASIVRRAPAVQESTRTQEIVLLLSEAASSAVSIGSSVRVETRLPTESNGFWVPSRALTAGPRGLWAVFVAMPPTDDADYAHHKIERRQVELLRTDGEWSEIQGPLANADKLVVEGVHRITPGQHVTCVPSESILGANP